VTRCPNPAVCDPIGIARTDQQLATANDRLEKLLAQYRDAVADDWVTPAVLATSLAMRPHLEHIDVALIAGAAMQRLTARDNAASGTDTSATATATSS
jgi:hypothetical protein